MIAITVLCNHFRATRIKFVIQFNYPQLDVGLG
ncbi:MAG TPA: hypothetical protein [Caudoviricetes sp.]|nr:MAG TPA: hypothetical protein [Caudoviricetes sp.]